MIDFTHDTRLRTTAAAACVIRPLAQGDIGALQEIDRVGHGHPWSRRTFIDEIEQNDRVHIVAEHSGVIVGHAAAWLDDSSCRITNVAVAEGHIGQGNASMLLMALVRTAIATGTVSNLQLEVRPGNRRAQRLYNRFGFVPVGIQRNFYDRRDGQGNNDALVMAVVDIHSESWRVRLEALDASFNARAIR